MGGNCFQYFVVEHNGDIYPCDFFVEADLKLGNIATDPWEDLQRSPKYVEFGAQKARWNELCGECRFLKYCSGDCLKHRLPATDEPRTLSWLCEGWKEFYGHALPGLEKLAVDIKQERLAARTSVQRPTKQPTVGRNDPCPCGSGKKYKKCCGA